MWSFNVLKICPVATHWPIGLCFWFVTVTIEIADANEQSVETSYMHDL